MHQQILEKRVRHPITKSVLGRIDERIKELQREYRNQWAITHCWSKNRKRLAIHSGNVQWELVFSKAKVSVFVDVPFYLVPLLSSYRDKAISLLDRELSELMT